MSGKVIGKELNLGFRGNVSRTPDVIIEAFANIGTAPIEFGAPVVFDAALGGVRAVSSEDSNNSGIIGIAVRRMGQPYADNAQGWYYGTQDSVDVLVRGSIMVELAEAAKTTAVAHGKVYVDAANGELTGTSGGTKLELPNAVFSTGKVDANNIVEVTILERKM